MHKQKLHEFIKEKATNLQVPGVLAAIKNSIGILAFEHLKRVFAQFRDISSSLINRTFRWPSLIYSKVNDRRGTASMRDSLCKVPWISNASTVLWTRPRRHDSHVHAAESLSSRVQYFCIRAQSRPQSRWPPPRDFVSRVLHNRRQWYYASAGPHSRLNLDTRPMQNTFLVVVNLHLLFLIVFNNALTSARTFHTYSNRDYYFYSRIQ